MWKTVHQVLNGLNGPLGFKRFKRSCRFSTVLTVQNVSWQPKSPIIISSWVLPLKILDTFGKITMVLSHSQSSWQMMESMSCVRIPKETYGELCGIWTSIRRRKVKIVGDVNSVVILITSETLSLLWNLKQKTRSTFSKLILDNRIPVL